MSDTALINCDNQYLSAEDIIRALIRIDEDGNWYLATSGTTGGAGCDYCPPEPINDGEVMTVSGGAWISAAVPTELPASGTSGNLLTSNGATWASTAPDSTPDLDNVTFDSTPNADHTATGVLWTMTAAVNVDKGDACYLDSSGKMALCKADAIANCPHFWGVATEAITANNAGKFLTHGMMRDDSFAFTQGARIWVSTTGTTGNTLTETAPSGANNVVMPIGVAATSDVIWVNQNFTTVEHS